MIANNSVVGWSFIVYIGVMLVIGWAAFQRTQDLADYILGGRSLEALEFCIVGQCLGYVRLVITGPARCSICFRLKR